MHEHRWDHGRVFAGAARFTRDAPADSGGLFRLGAGRTDWERLDEAHGLPEAAQVRAVAVDPANEQVVWCGTDAGPYRSMDGGDRWEAVELPGPYRSVWSLAFEPVGGDDLFAGTAPAALYRGRNRGRDWELVTGARIPERLDMGFPTRLISMAINPADGAEWWAGVEVGGMMRSGDGGRTWVDVSDGLEALGGEERWKSRLLSESDAEGMLDVHRVTLSSAAPGSAFLALRMGVFRSDDKGASWRSVDVGRFSPLTYCRDVRVSPHDPTVLYAALSDESVGAAGSLWRSDDLGETWWRFDRGLLEPVSTMMQVAPSPTDPAEVWCATRRGDVWATTDGGEHWRACPLPAAGRDIYALICG